MLINELNLKGVLSFGPDTPPLALEPLNVLIGPNGSGKSNYIEAIGLLRSASSKLAAPMRGAGGGGVTEWMWKGEPAGNAHVEATVDSPRSNLPLRHAIAFIASHGRFELIDERIEDEHPRRGNKKPTCIYQFQGGRPVARCRNGEQRYLPPETVALDESILSQRKDPDQYPELAFLANAYANIKVYREWSFGRTSVFRVPQPADLPNDSLEEDFSNLGLFLNHLRGIPRAKEAIIGHLGDLYDGLTDFDVRVKGGTVQVFLTEGDFVIPASRLSDGTLRYLCLLAILCDPDPPPLVCIEEPELGLHPDVLPKLADLMAEASERTQIVATTHSDILVDALTERPEAVVVVEKREGQTFSQRLNPEGLEGWLKKYRLGQLWTRGEIGGVRW